MLDALKRIRRIGARRWACRTAARQVWQGVLGRPILIRLPTGMAYLVHPGDAKGAEVFVAGGDTDRGAAALFHRLMAPGGLFLDVGAGAGYHALYMYPKCAGVHAFDADAANLGRLSAYGLPRLVVHPDAGPVPCLDEMMRGRRHAVTGIRANGGGLAVLRGARSLMVEDRPVVLAETPEGDLGGLYGVADDAGYVVGGFPAAAPFRLFAPHETAGLGVAMWFLVPRERAPELDRR